VAAEGYLDQPLAGEGIITTGGDDPIEGLVKKLTENSVTIVDEIEEFENGKFVHILDPEGNKIELWEPVDSVFTQIGGETTK